MAVGDGVPAVAVMNSHASEMISNWSSERFVILVDEAGPRERHFDRSVLLFRCRSPLHAGEGEEMRQSSAGSVSGKFARSELCSPGTVVPSYEPTTAEHKKTGGSKAAR